MREIKLTSTSANHLANIAKEMYEALETKLESLKLYNKDFTLAINNNSFRVENESEKSELASLSEGLKEIGELKSFIAFLREGIKAKEKATRDESFEKHVAKLISEGREDLKKPEEKKEVTFEEEFEKLADEQKAKYYSLEAKCATIGSFIHPDGAFAKARKAFFENTKNPTKVCGKGQEAEINTFSTSFTPEEVDAQFFSLQKEYRTLQAEFNKMKATIDEKVSDANKGISEANLNDTRVWIETRKVERGKYDEVVKAMKIAIPQNLKGIYEKVNAVASAK